MINASSGDTIWLEAGTYKEHVIVKSGVTIRSRALFQAVIDGKGKGTVVTLTKNSNISGCEITNGTIGVFSNGLGNGINSCKIHNNWQTGVVVVRHLPKIEDNLIIFNRASGIQGWDVRSTVASVNHNTIAYNQNHGISIGGSSNIIVENNTIAFNQRLGLKIRSESEAVRLTHNNLYANLSSSKSSSKGKFCFRSGIHFQKTNTQLQTQ